MDIGRSFVNTQYRFVLWTHPKCGSTSLKGWFGELLGYWIARRDDRTWCFWAKPPLKLWNDNTLHQMANRFLHYQPAEHDGFVHFTVVRHPLPRLISHYRQEMDGGPSYNLRADCAKSEQQYATFREFVQIILGAPPDKLNPHVAPLQAALEDVPLQRSIRLEHIAEEWPPWMARLGLPAVSLRYRWPRNRWHGCCADWPATAFFAAGLRPHWRDYYDDSLRDAVLQYYQTDVARWYGD